MANHQYSLTLIHREANGSVIDQRSVDGYINATALCKAAGKLWSDYRRNSTTIAFLSALEADMGIPISGLVHSVKGGDPHMQGTWVHPQVAIHLGQWLSAEFAVKVSKWVYEWMSGKGTPKPTLPVHLERYWLNDHKIMPGFFSILQEAALGLFGPLHKLGFDIPKGWVPDISVGLIFCKWLRTYRNIDTQSLPTYKHDYNDGRSPVDAKMYPDDLLADYRRWFHSVWLPEHGPRYFRSKDPSSLQYLDQLPALAAPSKAGALPKAQ